MDGIPTEWLTQGGLGIAAFLLAIGIAVLWRERVADRKRQEQARLREEQARQQKERRDQELQHEKERSDEFREGQRQMAKAVETLADTVREGIQGLRELVIDRIPEGRFPK